MSLRYNNKYLIYYPKTRKHLFTSLFRDALICRPRIIHTLPKEIYNRVVDRMVTKPTKKNIYISVITTLKIKYLKDENTNLSPSLWIMGNDESSKSPAFDP